MENSILQKLTLPKLIYSFNSISMKITTLVCETWQKYPKMCMKMPYTWCDITAKMEKVDQKKKKNSKEPDSWLSKQLMAKTSSVEH